MYAFKLMEQLPCKKNSKEHFLRNIMQLFSYAIEYMNLEEININECAMLVVQFGNLMHLKYFASDIRMTFVKHESTFKFMCIHRHMEKLYLQMNINGLQDESTAVS